MCAAVFRHVCQGGGDANDPARLATLAQRLAPLRDPQSDEVKQALRANTDLAISKGVFGVPTFEVDGRLFWGVDSVGMPVAYLQGDPWFDGPNWQAPKTTIAVVVRTPSRQS